MYLLFHAPDGEAFQFQAAYEHWNSAARYFIISLVKHGMDPLDVPSVEELGAMMVLHGDGGRGVDVGSWRIKKIIPSPDTFESEYDRLVGVHKEDAMRQSRLDLESDLQAAWEVFSNNGGTVDKFNEILDGAKIYRL